MINGNFKGVVIKYLNNDIVYKRFINFVKNTFKNKFKSFAFSTNYKIKSKEINLKLLILVLKKLEEKFFNSKFFN